ncbi:Uncharacterised protein [Mycobacteroides abscessus subsp. abscessus]|nr:Uncharacterised protein [Mycobacteroides abscessus subsp. abscessus]
MLCGKTDPLQPGREHRVGHEGATGRVDRRGVLEADGLGEDQLLMTEGSVQLRHLDGAGVTTGRGDRRRGRGRRGCQVPGAEDRCLDAMLYTADPGRVFAQFAGAITGRQHHDRGTVGNRCYVMLVQGVGEIVPGQ